MNNQTLFTIEVTKDNIKLYSDIIGHSKNKIESELKEMIAMYDNLVMQIDDIANAKKNLETLLNEINNVSLLIKNYNVIDFIF